jgi:hypothetical protein
MVRSLEIVVDLLKVPEVVGNAEDARDADLLGLLDHYELLDRILVNQPYVRVRIEELHTSSMSDDNRSSGIEIF